MFGNPLRISVPACAALVLLACNPFAPSPGQTVRQFLTELSAGNADDAKKQVICPPGAEAKLSLALAGMVMASRASGGITSVEILSEDVHGDAAHVVFLAHTPLPSEVFDKKDSMDLQMIDGQWKISVAATMAHPET
jgi:hypothetical protein